MIKHKVLVLTDHSTHSDQNSIYSLLREMQSHQRCDSVDVCSRSIRGNSLFFEGNPEAVFYVKKIDHSFSFSDGDDSFLPLAEGIKTEYSIVFIRLPRPVSDEFLLWLEEEFSSAVIINRPSGIIETSNKSFLLNFPDLCPPIKLVQSIDNVMKFSNKFPIVLKPLRDYGGRGLLKINGNKVDDGSDQHDLDTYLLTIKDVLESEGYLAMKYLTNVSKGDKRIIVVNGQIMAASLRLPAEGSWLCNVAQGGRSVASEVDADEEKIVDSIAPVLKNKGVLIYGVDTLVDDSGKRVLSEVNTLSIGGFPQAQIQTGQPIIKQTIQQIIQYADEHI